MRCRNIALSLMLVLSLAACGSTQEDRGLSGAGIGAAAGGATGLLTDKSQVNLGDPVWKKGDKAQASAAGAGSDTVRGIQSGLGKLGYDAGPADGKTGPKTRAAIRQYQERNSLLVDGQPSDALLAHIQKQI